MKLCSTNHEDLAKAYVGTFAKFTGWVGDFEAESKKLDAGEQIHYISKVFMDYIMGTRLMEDGTQEQFKFYLNPTEEGAPEIEVVFPKKSYFNTKFGACLLFRIPARQWKKGINHQNTAIHKLSEEGTFREMDVGFEMLNYYIKKPCFMPLEQRILSYAISSRMAVSPDCKLFIDQTRVGRVNYNSKEIYLGHSMFIPHVQRVLREFGQQNYKISVDSNVKKKPRTVDGVTINTEGFLEETAITGEI